MDAIQTLEDLMRRHREEGRGVEYADLVPVLAALKAQRDELLAGLQMAYIAMQHMGNVLNNIDAVDEDEDAQHDAAFESVAALIAKHKEASHG